ncbi:MAG TPA: hypothetical protein VNF04_11410, partial [Stellaceae bacterium]|nr:hypothetical protein [Stellaceae bacterium]
IGYKAPIAWMPGSSAGVYLVQPYTQIATPLGGFSDESGANGAGSLPITAGSPSFLSNIGKTPMPDVALVVNWEQPWGHFQLHGVLRDEELKDGLFISRNYIGYGGGFSGDVKPQWLGWMKDRIGFQAYGGEGLGHWNNPPGAGANTLFQAIATNYGTHGLYGNGGPTSATGASAIVATTVTSWGGEVNYQHWWTPTLRSSLTYGIGHQDLPMALLKGGPGTGAYNKEIETAHANLIWSPVPFIDTGFEYIYDRRLTAMNVRGSDGHILDFDFKVKF